MAYSMIVTLTPNLDYIKRVDEVVADASKGITQNELDRCSKSAQDDIMIQLDAVGFPITTWTSEANTPFNVAECIRLLGSARAWGRMLMMYAKDTPFEETYGATLLNQANQLLESLVTTKAVIDPSTGAVVRPTLSEGSKGVPKFSDTGLGIEPSSKAVTNFDLDDFIRQHGQSEVTRTQGNPYLSL